MKTLYSFSVLRHFVVSFFVGLFLLGAGEVWGTHIGGADLTYTCIGSNQYRLTLTVYRECHGTSLANPQAITWSGAGSACSGSFNITRISTTDITPLSTGVLSRCASAGGTIGIQKHVFQTIVTFPSQCTGITFRWSSSSRSNTITTLSGPGGQNAFIQAYMGNPPCNSSPTFNSTPLLYSCVNQPVNYNLGASDPDGDSLAYALTSCWEGNSNNVNYLAGYSGTSFLGAGVPISLNPITGDLSFTPTSPAVTPICIRINEYRNGVLIGYTMRDLQYSAYNCTNSPPSLSGINNTNDYNITISNTTNLCFDVHSIDPNSDTIINMGFSNTNFIGATFNATLGNDTASGTFCWSPSLGDTGIHYLQIFVWDNGLPITLQTVKTYTIVVIPDNILGIVYQDLNSNCIQDANEPGILNRAITVNPGNIIVNTNGNGLWGFDTLPAGNYTATVDTSSNWLPTCPIVQNFTVVHPDSATIAPSFGLISGNEPPLLSGVDSSNNYTITVFANHTLCFDVYSIDTNGNAITNMGVVGSLLGASFTSSLSNNTGVGTYCWTPTSNNIGTRTIQIYTQDGGTPFSAQTVKTYTIIVVPQKISGYVFKDLNSNCIKDASEWGIQNRVVVVNPGNILLTTNGNNGYWGMDSLPLGNYTVSVVPIINWVSSCTPIQNFTVVHLDSSINPLALGIVYKNDPPLLSGIDSTSNYAITIFANTTLCFDVYAIDTNGNAINSMGFATASPPNATLTSTQLNGVRKGTFCWTPTSNDVGVHSFQLRASDNGSPVSAQVVKTYTITVIQTNITGSVYQDLNQNCIRETTEVGLANRMFIINPGNIIVTSSSYGFWGIDSLPSGNYTITADTSSNNWQLTCPPTQNFTVIHPDSMTIPPSFGFISTTPCPSSYLTISSGFLRPGFSQQPIWVSVGNSYTATNSLNNAYVIVELDHLITVQNCTRPYTNLGNNQYRIDVGTIAQGQYLNFVIFFQLSPTAVLGQTLCMSAELYPIASCELDTIPNPYAPANNISPCNLPYDNSSLQVDVSCDNDTVQFVVHNGGSGNMDCFAPVRVYLDGIWILSDSIQLLAGDSAIFRYSGDGRTWRLEADQHPLHPGNSRPNATIERCGNLANWTPNLVNILPPDDADPHVDINCRLVSAAYDPNDKTGYPLGVGTQHDIQPNQDIEYVINFQNTGNDTAFTVVIRDTLPMDLNIFTVQSGASSHDYTFRMYGPRILEWTFNNIMLPDSNVNEAASHGFTSFRVKQVPNLPVGTLIENSAAIYFDFNAPVITNTSWHTIALPQDLNWAGQQTVNTATCGDYTLNNFTYNTSGTYWQALNYGGLDSLYTLNVTILDSTTATISENTCYSYTAPDAQVYTMSGQYQAVIPNAAGCDSVITINLTIKDSSSAVLNEVVCQSYTAPDAQVYTTSGQYTAIIPNAIGCDSTIIINLTILNNAAVVSENACNTYTAPDAQIYTTSGQYTAVIPNAAGCDSTITINLTITDSSTALINETVCNSYVAPDAQIYTTSGLYFAVIPNAAGCDSTITINLTIQDSSTASINETVCNSYVAPDAQVYTTSGQYIAVIPNTAGCDSTILINLNIDNQPSDSISLFGTTLTAYTSGINYQWIDCNNGNTPIAGETNQSFTPLLSGDYAVEMTDGACTVVSNCVNVNVVSMSSIANDLGIWVYPNPVQSMLYIDKMDNEQIHFQLMDNLGRILISNSSNEPITKINLADLPAGIYYISINNGKKLVTQKVVKQ